MFTSASSLRSEAIRGDIERKREKVREEIASGTGIQTRGAPEKVELMRKLGLSVKGGIVSQEEAKLLKREIVVSLDFPTDRQIRREESVKGELFRFTPDAAGKQLALDLIKRSGLTEGQVLELEGQISERVRSAREREKQSVHQDEELAAQELRDLMEKVRGLNETRKLDFNLKQEIKGVVDGPTNKILLLELSGVLGRDEFVVEAVERSGSRHNYEDRWPREAVAGLENKWRELEREGEISKKEKGLLLRILDDKKRIDDRSARPVRM